MKGSYSFFSYFLLLLHEALVNFYLIIFYTERMYHLSFHLPHSGTSLALLTVEWHVLNLPDLKDLLS